MKSPLLTVLNFSGGKQSSALLWMVLRGEIERPDNFVVINADPGMENSLTYDYVAKMKTLCNENDIYFETACGPNLYKDLTSTVPITINGKEPKIENPPYWTKSKDGKVGKLMQKCTRHYKIRPMDRAVRRLLKDKYGYNIDRRSLPNGCVEKWIGFAYDEMRRIIIPDPKQRYIVYKYPLIDRFYTKDAVEAYFLDNDIPMPPRSVCNACFANGLDTLRDMYYNRPKDWEQAVEVDKNVRSMKSYGINKEIYVSKTLIGLEDLPKFNFDPVLIKKYLNRDFDPDKETIFVTDKISNDDDDGWSCDSGYCFL